MEQIQKTHYVCLECKGVSDTPGVCMTEDCPRNGKPLAECSCTDGEHLSATPVDEMEDELEAAKVS